MMFIAWLASVNRKKFPWRTVLWGVSIQLGLGLALLKTSAGDVFFSLVSEVVERLLEYTNAGTRQVFGDLMDTGFSFALGVLPIVVFMGSLFGILYHLGVVQVFVSTLSTLLTRSMKTSPAESLAAVSNVFVGMIESCLVIKPYMPNLTRSELFATMSVGMATVAGSVLLAYVNILGGGAFAGHLLTASILSAPAGLLLAKIIVPETEIPKTATPSGVAVEKAHTNLIDAAAEGALNGLRMAAYIGAMLVAFVALIHMANDILGAMGLWLGIPDLSFQGILGFLLSPLAFMMGVPWEDAPAVGSLIGVKIVLNEFIAYQELGAQMANGELTERSRIIASYALCGFANFGSLAILLGGIGGMAPGRRPEVARLGLRSILAGSLATFMTACVAGILL
ncbi:MAG: NupC/NupG family nucleoside CNT transporter [Deltaproteobacteria bacterium]|nr:NupC/NupG family nucleoside CNT transporter [Deltaproteobacteria bacterium]